MNIKNENKRTYSALRLLLILSWHRAEPSSKLYRKSWLLNDLIPGFDTEALRVSPSISKGATAFVPLHLRVGLLAGMATAAKEAVSTVRRLRPVLPETLRRTRCGCSRREKRFLNLNVRGREPLSKFSNKMSNALANREFLTIRCIPTAGVSECSAR